MKAIPKLGDEACTMCKLAMSYVKSFITKDSTEQDIMNALDKVCNFLSGDMAQEVCIAYVKCTLAQSKSMRQCSANTLMWGGKPKVNLEIIKFEFVPSLLAFEGFLLDKIHFRRRLMAASVLKFF